MSSAAKTLDLLAYFSVTRPEIGLSQFCKLANHDKATTYRYLQTLEDKGFVEKAPLTKRYRLGPTLLQLAQLRELNVPLKTGAEGPLRRLAESTGETAHISVLSGTTLYCLDAIESPRHSIRAIIDLQTLPLHATASGICAIAFGPSALIEAAHEKLEGFTSHTATTPQDLEAEVQLALQTGFGHSDNGYEDGIFGLAAPVYDQTGNLAGTISVASVASRLTKGSKQKTKHCLIAASREISRNWGGTVPHAVEDRWALNSSQSEQLEITA